MRTDGDVWSTGWDHDVLSNVQHKGPKKLESKKFLDIFLPDAECPHKPEPLPFQSVRENGDNGHTSNSSDELIPVLFSQSEIKKYCVLDQFVNMDSCERAFVSITKEATWDVKFFTKK